MKNEYFVSGVVTTKKRGSFAVICSQYYDGNVMDVYGNDEDEARASAESIIESLNAIAERDEKIKQLEAQLVEWKVMYGRVKWGWG